MRRRSSIRPCGPDRAGGPRAQKPAVDRNAAPRIVAASQETKSQRRAAKICASTWRRAPCPAPPARAGPDRQQRDEPPEGNVRRDETARRAPGPCPAPSRPCRRGRARQIAAERGRQGTKALPGLERDDPCGLRRDGRASRRWRGGCARVTGGVRAGGGGGKVAAGGATAARSCRRARDLARDGIWRRASRAG